MNWPVFAVQVVLGGLLGVFAARAYAWKHRALEWKDRYEKEVDINQSIARSPLPPDHALIKALKTSALAQPLMPSAQQIVNGVTMRGQAFDASKVTDDMLEKILTDLGAVGKKPEPVHMIQEEP